MPITPPDPKLEITGFDWLLCCSASHVQPQPFAESSPGHREAGLLLLGSQIHHSLPLGGNFCPGMTDSSGASLQYVLSCLPSPRTSQVSLSEELSFLSYRREASCSVFLNEPLICGRKSQAVVRPSSPLVFWVFYRVMILVQGHPS